jgi:MFS family permease
MTNATLPTDRYAERDFRIGHALSRALSVLSRNFLPFFGINLVAVVPDVLLQVMTNPFIAPAARGLGLSGGTITTIVLWLLTIVLSVLSKAVLLYGTFQDLLGRPLNIGESLRVGFSRFFPIIGVGLVVGILTGLSAILLIFPAFIVYTMWFVAAPACVVERLGPLESMSRSGALTKGYRWRIFGMVFLLWIVSAIITGVLAAILYRTVGIVAAIVGVLIWAAVYGGFFSVFVAVTYRDLRVAKEGVDTELIASVFD